VAPAIGPWRRHGLRLALWTHFYLTVVFYIVLSCKVPENAFMAAVNRPLRYLFSGFGSVNAYGLFAWLDQEHSVVEFAGSNDGGQTWRVYDYRYFPQRADRIPPFIAPRFPRFEAALQIELGTRDKPTTLYALTANRLLERSPEVMRLFERDPFADRPAQMIRLQVYRLSFTDLATHRATGRYWNRNYVGEYLPMKYLTPRGEILEASTAFDQVYVKAAYGNPSAQNYLGFLYISGEEGVTRDGAEAAKWFRQAAEQGVAGAQLNLALILANGDGVPKDAGAAAKWCRLAAKQGLPEAQDRLGIMYFQGEGVPQDEIEALVWFGVAALSGHAEAAKHQTIAELRVGTAAALAAAQRSRVIFDEIAVHKKKSGD
jgi:TPR repeat protein